MNLGWGRAGWWADDEGGESQPRDLKSLPHPSALCPWDTLAAGSSGSTRGRCQGLDWRPAS